MVGMKQAMKTAMTAGVIKKPVSRGRAEAKTAKAKKTAKGRAEKAKDRAGKAKEKAENKAKKKAKENGKPKLGDVWQESRKDTYTGPLGGRWVGMVSGTWVCIQPPP